MELSYFGSLRDRQERKRSDRQTGTDRSEGDWKEAGKQVNRCRQRKINDKENFSSIP